MMGFAFLDPVFANHLSTFGLNIIEVGVVFSVGTLSYSLCMIVIGKFSLNLSYLMVLGCVFYIISFILLRPQSMTVYQKTSGLFVLGWLFWG